MSEDRSVSFLDLVGCHTLSAVWFGEVQINNSGWFPNKANCTYFLLDGRIYRAMEDPDDGYRSCLGTIEIVLDQEPENVFGEHEVCVLHSRTAVPKSQYATKEIDDVLIFLDIITARVVLQIGTTNTNDYYPCYESYFDPKALRINNG